MADAGPEATPRTLDLRAFTESAAPAPRDDTAGEARATGSLDGGEVTLAALDGHDPHATRAAAAAALLLHAATGCDPSSAASAALAALQQGRARAIAHRLRR